ncbi:hypothetical protein M2169_000050 [Streptomyces sp. MJP52]|nr:hypothetical protein [Streptomyces sp. MJP52]
MDGTLIPIERTAADEPYHSAKHRKHGMNAQVIARPDGTPLWFSRAAPGRTHDRPGCSHLQSRHTARAESNRRRASSIWSK